MNPKTTTGIGPLLIGLVVVALLVGVALYFYARHHHNEYDQGGGHRALTITNQAQTPYIVSLPSGKRINLPPDQTTGISIAQHDTISAQSHNYDGTVVRHHFKVSNPQISELHITPSGFRSEASGSDNVTFVNEAPFPVMFIERSSKGGRRWATDIVPPRSEVRGHFVGRRSHWQIVHPTAEDQPISQLTVGGKPVKLVFDGQSLKSY